MHELTPEARRLLADEGFDASRIQSLKGDLSSRRYLRVSGAQGSAILMILADGDQSSLSKIIDMTKRLTVCGLSVPRIIATNSDAGLAIIEDFGDLHLADLLRGGSAPEPLLATYLDAISLAREADRSGLPAPDAETFASWIDIAKDWLPGIDVSVTMDLRAALANHLRHILHAPRVVSLRDAHAENVIWLAGRDAAAKAGLIDFQDAFAFHPLYDISSILRDARIDIPEDVVEHLLKRAAQQIGMDAQEARFAFDLLTFQRNMRIAAVFHRSARRDGKSAHLVHLPRVLGHVARAAQHPELTDLAKLLPHITAQQARTA